MSNTTAALDDYRWLLGSEGESWLRRVAEDDRSSVAVAAALRKDLSAARTHLVLEQTELRRRAMKKFTDGARMFFTRVGLEQASDQMVAAYKTQRFPAGRRVDLCCGIGGDLLALAAVGPTLGIDRDPTSALLAAENLRRLGIRGSQVAVADAASVACDGATAWHVDPDRRSGGRRSVHLRWHSPDEAAMESFRRRAPDGAVKLAPAAMVPESWQRDAELEWISRAGECRQQLAWFGRLAQSPGRRRATVICSRRIDQEPEMRSVVGLPNVATAMASKIGRYVFEPDVAVAAAGLVSTLAAAHSIEMLSSGGVYLTTDRMISDPAMACFEVDEVLPFDRKRVRRLLAARGLGRLEIKTRGVRHDPEQLRRELRVEGDSVGVLIVGCFEGRTMVILARRI